VSVKTPSFIGRVSILLALASVCFTGSANAQTPTILNCVGTTQIQTNGVQSSQPTSRYYRISDHNFQIWSDKTSVWSENYCDLGGYKCEISPVKFFASDNPNPDRRHGVASVAKIDREIEIDRKTGQVTDLIFLKDNGELAFSGECRLSIDPAIAGSNKF